MAADTSSSGRVSIWDTGTWERLQTLTVRCVQGLAGPFTEASSPYQLCHWTASLASHVPPFPWACETYTEPRTLRVCTMGVLMSSTSS